MPPKVISPAQISKLCSRLLLLKETSYWMSQDTPNLMHPKSNSWSAHLYFSSSLPFQVIIMYCLEQYTSYLTALPALILATYNYLHWRWGNNFKIQIWSCATHICIVMVFKTLHTLIPTGLSSCFPPMIPFQLFVPITLSFFKSLPLIDHFFLLLLISCFLCLGCFYCPFAYLPSYSFFNLQPIIIPSMYS